MKIHFFSKIFKLHRTNIFLFSLLLTQIVLPTFELFKPNSAMANNVTATNLNVTNDATIDGQLTINAGINSGSFSDGSLVIIGDLGVSGDIYLQEGLSTPDEIYAGDELYVGESLNLGLLTGDMYDGTYGLEIDVNGIKTNGINLIKRENNGEIHIGVNSLITIEQDGKQKLYAQDESGNAIPIDITNGSKLLINGRDVEQSINNVGAMSAALTGLPTIPVDTNLACGVGTGTHGGDFAFSGGCASKVNENLSVNYAASMIMPGQDYAGNFEDQFSARAGFVWQLGKSNKSTQISMNQKKDSSNILKKHVQQIEVLNEKLAIKDNEISQLKDIIKNEKNEIKKSERSQNKLISNLSKKLNEQDKLLKKLLAKLANK